MCRVGLLLAAFVIGLCQARTLPNRSKQVKAYAYVLPAGAEEIRDDINHSFVCANRTDGFYVDIDNDCQIFHRCQDRARFSFICAEKTVFSQMYQTCVHEGQLGFPCEDSGMFFPDAEESSTANSEAESSSEGESTNEEQQPAAEPNSAAVMMPAQVLLPPEEESMMDASNDEEKLIGSVVAMPISDNYVNMFDHQQINDDKFDPVEEEEADNTAQEMLDEQTDVQSSETALHEVVDSTQEVEVNDVSNESNNVGEEILAETYEANSDDEHEHVADDTNVQSEHEAALSEEVQPIMQLQLHHDVQEVEESEPVVQDFQEEEHTPEQKVSDVQNTQSVEPDNSNNINDEDDSNIIENNIVDDQLVNEPVQEAEAHESVSDEEALPSLENIIAEAELEHDDKEESEQKVEEISATIEHDDVTEEKIQEPEAALIQSQSVSHAVEQTPVDDQSQTVMNEVHPLTATLAEKIAEPSSSMDLPEFIVSTVADLRRGVVPPALRRRKTFLFKADAVPS
ncbi:AAEL012013-PA [Aedes aegypti]|uniref:AAEL012013-PA n=1 Tax=Aedes aegypti TaxID=7159 RepID=Q16NC4_AEDAE|nr:AAEL012013-PA [Aedes aegypti]